MSQAGTNVPIPYSVFQLGGAPDTPVSRMVNGIFASRHSPEEALAWFRDARDGAGEVTDAIERAVAAVAYQCLKNGGVPTGVRLMEALRADRPSSARVRFGLGRGLRAAGREGEAQREFREALRLDPGYEAAAEALRTKRTAY